MKSARAINAAAPAATSQTVRHEVPGSTMAAITIMVPEPAGM